MRGREDGYLETLKQILCRSGRRCNPTAAFREYGLSTFTQCTYLRFLPECGIRTLRWLSVRWTLVAIEVWLPLKGGSSYINGNSL